MQNVVINNIIDKISSTKILIIPQLKHINKKINITGIFTCDTMVCPTNAVKCRVTKTTTDDLTQIKRKRMCMGPNGMLFNQKKNDQIFIPLSIYSHSSSDRFI